MSKTILVVEDELIVALMMVDWLADQGYVAINRATYEAALQRIRRGGVDAAILDLRLLDGNCYPIAAELRSRSIPFAFMTGSAASEISSTYSDVPVLTKPFRFDDAQRILVSLLG